jgi:hypothetical protein
MADLFDARLAAVMPEREYRQLKARAECAYRRIENAAPPVVLGELDDVLLVMREIEARLLDGRPSGGHLAPWRGALKSAKAIQKGVGIGGWTRY